MAQFIKVQKTKTLTTSITINSKNNFCPDEFLNYADITGLKCYYSTEKEVDTYFFAQENISTTLFLLLKKNDGYELFVDNIAAYADLKFFPYLADTLTRFLNGEVAEHSGVSLYKTFDEEWVADTISEEVALIKGTLSIVPQYFPSLPITEGSYVSLDALRNFGVNIHSSTPRIYGYLQYMMHNGLLPCGAPLTLPEAEETIEVDIPQHKPVGKVKSWQLDGCETYETYSCEDVELLLTLASEYGEGRHLHGVVLNDIGTLYHEGVGVAADGEKAVYWLGEAIKAGDTLYAPTNLGDLYRKGCGTVKPSLEQAIKAYKLSTDPYAHYRIGQSFEEGWTSPPNMSEAIKWYEQAAHEGHHLAIKRIKELKAQ